MDIINKEQDGRDYKFAFAWNVVKGEDGAIIKHPRAFKGEKKMTEICAHFTSRCHVPKKTISIVVYNVFWVYIIVLAF